MAIPPPRHAPPAGGTGLPARSRGPTFVPTPAAGRRAALFLSAVAVSVLVGFAVAYLPLLLVAGGLVALAGGLLILRFPYLGLLLYLVIFILRPGEVYPILGVLRLERVIGVLTLGALVLRDYHRYGTFTPDTSPQTKALLIFIGAVVLSIPFSYWRGESIATFVELLKALGLYVMTVHLIDSRRKLHVFAWLYMLCVLYLNLTSLINYYTGHGAFSQGIDRATGATSAAGNANELGTTLACTFPMYLLFALRETAKWRRLAAGGAGLIGVWGMILTGSRASLLGFLGGLVYLWWRSRHRLAFALAGVILVAFAFSIMPDQYKGRYSTITSSELDESSQARVMTWLTGLQMVIDRPVFGVGAGCFGVARAMGYSPEFRKVWLESHSLYIQVVTEVGLVGAFAFFLFVSRFLRLNRRVARMLEGLRSPWKLEQILVTALFAGFIVLLISGIFGHSLYRRTWYLYAGLGLAMFRILSAERDAFRPDASASPTQAP